MCVIFISWQGEMTRNSRSIARSFNAAMEEIGRAVTPKSQSPWVYIREQSQTASWMASNCSGAFLLGKAGVLDGKRATTWAGGEKGLLKAYPAIKVQFDTNVVIDDKVITSNGGPVSYQAAFELLERLSSKKFATEISEAIQFNRLERAFKP